MLGKSCKLIDFEENHHNKTLFFIFQSQAFPEFLGGLINRKKTATQQRLKTELVRKK